MKKIMCISGILCIIASFCFLWSSNSYAGFKICLMQEQKGAAAQFRPLLDYLRKKGVNASFVAAKTYPQAAKMFENGKVDGMFSGSGIAGCMIIKDLAYPVVRPEKSAGWSTYWAVVLAPKGSSRFTQNPEYFDGKRIHNPEIRRYRPGIIHLQEDRGAHDMKGDREMCLKAGMDDYVTKPIRRETVFQMIEKWIISRET